MKKRFLKFACVASLAMILVLPGCKKDDTPDRDKFLGSYNVNENCSSGNFNYSITITESANSEDAIVIGNFGDYSVNVRATVSGNNITFNDTQDAITFSGSGNISGSTLTIIYTASANGVADNCTKTCIKQ
ncbi:MAG: hypothetical protein IPN76_22250 [Saprospiraceae bacterium]|nr:hypothetical protein [Saprospiraceae bacterium]